MSTPAIGPTLRQSIDDVAKSLATSDRGVVTAEASTTGATIGLAYRPSAHVTVGGWAGRQWGAKGWTGAVTGRFSW